MDLTTVMNLISTIGFPIAISLVLMWYIMKLNENHSNEVKALTCALNNNTVILQRVCDKLDLELDEKGINK